MTDFPLHVRRAIERRWAVKNKVGLSQHRFFCECGEVITAPVAVAFVSPSTVQNSWVCSACGATFETTIDADGSILCHRAVRKEPMEARMLSRFSIDDSPHNRDGLVIRAYDGDTLVDAFISRRVMDEWVEPVAPPGRRRSLFPAQYNELGQRNLDSISRIVSTKYDGGKAHNRQHPYVEILTSDIIDSGESIDQTGLVRTPLPPAFVRVDIK